MKNTNSDLLSVFIFLSLLSQNIKNIVVRKAFYETCTHSHKIGYEKESIQPRTPQDQALSTKKRQTAGDETNTGDRGCVIRGGEGRGAQIFVPED